MNPTKSRMGDTASKIQKHKMKMKQDAPLMCVELPLMHDVMLLCNRFIEVSKEFSGIIYFTDQPLHQFITTNLVMPSVEVFKQD